MDLSKINTKKFLFDPKDPDFEKKMIDRSPVFQLPRNRKKWLTYITLVYDMNSEIRRNQPHYIERKSTAATIVGFEKNKDSGRFEPIVEAALLSKDETLNKAVVQFVYYCFNNNYKLLYVLSERYDDAIRAQSMPGVSFGEADRKHLTAMQADIEALEEKIFGGAETMDMKKSLYEGIDNARERLPRKEEEIEQYEKNGLELYNPYKGYKPGKIKFVGDKIPEL